MEAGTLISASFWTHASPVTLAFLLTEQMPALLWLKLLSLGFHHGLSPSFSAVLLSLLFSNFSALSNSYITGGSVVLQENTEDLKGTETQPWTKVMIGKRKFLALWFFSIVALYRGCTTFIIFCCLAKLHMFTLSCDSSLLAGSQVFATRIECVSTNGDRLLFSIVHTPNCAASKMPQKPGFNNKIN